MKKIIPKLRRPKCLKGVPKMDFIPQKVHLFIPCFLKNPPIPLHPHHQKDCQHSTSPQCQNPSFFHQRTYTFNSIRQHQNVDCLSGLEFPYSIFPKRYIIQNGGGGDLNFQHLVYTSCTNGERSVTPRKPAPLNHIRSIHPSMNYNPS